MSKKNAEEAGTRLLTRAPQNRAHTFAIICPTGPFFQHPAKHAFIVTATTGYQTRSFVEAAERTEVAAPGLVGLGDPIAYITLPVQEQVALV